MARTHGAKYAKARVAFLYGDENGKRILTVRELSEKFGLNESRCCEAVRDWKKEYEQIFRETHAQRIGTTVDKEDLEADKRDAKFLRYQLDLLQEELDAHAEHVKFLEDLIESFDWTDKQMGRALEAFSTYLRIAGSRKSKLEHYLKVHARWRAMSGVEDKLGTADLYEKEIARAQAKDEFAREREGQKDQGPKRLPGTEAGFFQVEG